MIGTLRHIITLVDYSPTKEADGDWVTTPATIWSGWAAAERIGDSRNFQSQQVQLLQTYQFRLREQSLPIYQNTVLVWNNWEFTISAIENEGERDRYTLVTGTAKRKVPTDLAPVISTLLMRIAEFEVTAGAPMESGDTTYQNDNFPNAATYPIVFADGVRQQYVTGNGRSIAYNSTTKTITFSDAVFEGEIIAIYA
jgi:Phage head-tail joining protein